MKTDTSPIFRFKPLQILLFLAAGFAMLSCHDFPEEKTKPFLTLYGDSAVAFKGLLLPGDTLLYTTSYASRTEDNELFIGSYRSTLQPFEYQGPDSDFVAQRKIPVRGKINQKMVSKFLISGNIRPGNYTFYAFLKNKEGQLSDSMKFSYFINQLDYPVAVLDTPSNGLTGNHPIDSSAFKLVLRAFAQKMKRVELQWYDSLKRDTAAAREILDYPEGSTLVTIRKTQSFPLRKGRKFYLRLIVSNREDRKILFWIPFERRVNW